MSSIKLYSKFHLPIELENKFPSSRKDGKILSANHFSAEDKGNQFLFQELKGNGFAVRVNQFTINQPTSFTITSDSTINFQISMYETTEYELAGYGNITMHQRGYNLITVPSFSAQFKASKRSLFMPLEISFSNDYLKPVTATHPQVEEFLKNAGKGRAATLFNVNQIATTEMMALIDLIIHCGMNPDSDPDWINVYVAELLHHAFKSKPKVKKIKATKEEVECIYEAEQILDDIKTKHKSSSAMEMAPQSSSIDTMDIDSGISGNYWSARELAEYVNMSTYTFNKTFNTVFGQSVPNYIKETMWQAVLQALLLGEENMKTISSLAGYNDQPSFSRAFKKRFGNTPSEFVQEMKEKLKNYKKTAMKN